VLKMNRQPCWLVAALALGLVVLTPTAFTQENTATSIEILPVRGNIFLLSGAGANITLSVGPSGVLMVDSGSAEMSGKVIEAISKFSREISSFRQPVTQDARLAGGFGAYLSSYQPPKPIRFILDTTALADHVGGNAAIAKAGRTFTGGNVVGDLGSAAAEGAAIYAHVNLMNRLVKEDVPYDGLPTLTYATSDWKMAEFFNGEGIRLIHVPAATTDGDTLVHFRGSDVICAGEIFSMTNYPIIDIKRGGSIQGVLEGLNYMVNLVIPEFRAEGGTFVIPGHGRIGDDADLTEYRNMVTIIRDDIQDMIKRGMTLEQVKAAKPTEGWDARFGKNPAWTPDMFVEAVYKSLSTKQ